MPCFWMVGIELKPRYMKFDPHFLIPFLQYLSPAASVCFNDIMPALSIIFCNRQQLSRRMFHMSKLRAFPTQPSHSYQQQILLGHMTSETKGRPLPAFLHTNGLLRKASGMNMQIKSNIELLTDIIPIDFLKLFLLIVRRQKSKDHLRSKKESVRPHCRHRFYHTFTKQLFKLVPSMLRFDKATPWSNLQVDVKLCSIQLDEIENEW